MTSIFTKDLIIHLSWHTLTYIYHGISNQPSIHISSCKHIISKAKAYKQLY